MGFCIIYCYQIMIKSVHKKKQFYINHASHLKAFKRLALFAIQTSKMIIELRLKSGTVVLKVFYGCQISPVFSLCMLDAHQIL